ncbi:HIT domain-containing protein [Sansalvadorimonas sp. 2012CJ34-2]|uniref:HIT domain-containing protein n=1 Tax=Parendozoicomonas callyspongiae TaxID=2942213 RepID=A0ABT0PGT4_9GAMM|nr:HIT domain-containing protein [Sansalvadorimonas sp. 2012CJ34-2]MCL6270221.1 HIT domain-containing protein [Sansalvadorimonas sp. 2012CJ34-2]
MDHFELDQRLSDDCLVIGDFPLCRMLLMNDVSYPWFILVPRVAGVEEIYQLTSEEQQLLMKESSYVTEKLKDVFAADKMNVAALGNIVRQLHVHHVVRRVDDQAWPAPVWGYKSAVPYTEEQVEDIRQRLATVFTTWLVPAA